MADIWMRAGKGLIFSALMYFGVLKLGFPPDRALAIAVIPLVSAVVNILTGPIFSVSVIVFAVGMLNFAMNGAITDFTKTVLTSLTSHQPQGK